MYDIGFIGEKTVVPVLYLDVFLPHGQVGFLKPWNVTETFIWRRTDIAAQRAVRQAQAIERRARMLGRRAGVKVQHRGIITQSAGIDMRTGDRIPPTHELGMVMAGHAIRWSALRPEGWDLDLRADPVFDDQQLLSA